MMKRLSNIATVLVSIVVIAAMVISTIMASIMIMDQWFMIPDWYNNTAWYTLIAAVIAFVGGIIVWIVCAVIHTVLRKTHARKKAYRRVNG